VALLEMAINQLNMERCEASSVEYNHRAHKVLEESGFKKGGVERRSAFVNGQKWDRFRFDILRDEYLSVRMDLLKQALGDRLKDYLERDRSIRK
jgi:RimJ/RimL family protein N-acetyltransferase